MGENVKGVGPYDYRQCNELRLDILSSHQENPLKGYARMDGGLPDAFCHVLNAREMPSSSTSSMDCVRAGR